MKMRWILPFHRSVIGAGHMQMRWNMQMMGLPLFCIKSNSSSRKALRPASSFSSYNWNQSENPVNKMLMNVESMDRWQQCGYKGWLRPSVFPFRWADFDGKLIQFSEISKKNFVEKISRIICVLESIESRGFINSFRSVQFVVAAQRPRPTAAAQLSVAFFPRFDGEWIQFSAIWKKNFVEKISKFLWALETIRFLHSINSFWWVQVERGPRMRGGSGSHRRINLLSDSIKRWRCSRPWPRRRDEMGLWIALCKWWRCFIDAGQSTWSNKDPVEWN